MRRRRLPGRFNNPVPYSTLPETCSRPIAIPDRRNGGLIRRACRSRWCSKECTDGYNFRRAEPLIESLAQGRLPRTYIVLRPTRGTSFGDFMAALGRFTARARRLRRTFEFYRAIHFTERVDPHAHLLLLDYDIDFLNEILAESSIAEHLSLESVECVRDSFALTAYPLRVVREDHSAYMGISLSPNFVLPWLLKRPSERSDTSCPGSPLWGEGLPLTEGGLGFFQWHLQATHLLRYN